MTMTNFELADKDTVYARINGIKNLLAVTSHKGQLKYSRPKITLRFGQSAQTSGRQIELPLSLMASKSYDRAEVIALLAHELGHQFFTPSFSTRGDYTFKHEMKKDINKIGAHEFCNVVEDLRVDFLSNVTIPNSRVLNEYSLLKIISDREYVENVKSSHDVYLTGSAFIFEGYSLIFRNAKVKDLAQELKSELYARAAALNSARKMKFFYTNYDLIVKQIAQMISQLEEDVKQGNENHFFDVSTTILEIKALIRFFEKYFVETSKAKSMQMNKAAPNEDDSSEEQSDDSSDDDSQEDNSEDSENEDESGDSDDALNDSDNSEGQDDSSVGESSDDSDKSEDEEETSNEDTSKGVSGDVRQLRLEELAQLSKELMDNLDSLTTEQKELIEDLSTMEISFEEAPMYQHEDVNETKVFTLSQTSTQGKLSPADRKSVETLYKRGEGVRETLPSDIFSNAYWEQLEREAFSENVNLLGKLKKVLMTYTPKLYTAPCKSGFKLNKGQLHNIASGKYVNKPFLMKEKGIDLSTEIVLLTDVSGSMLSRVSDSDESEILKFNQVNKTMIVLCDALRKVGNNIKVTIGAYDDDVYSVKKSYEPFSKLKTNMPKPNGTTKGEYALLWALNCLKDSKAKRKIIICLTDGVWDRVNPQKQYDLIRKMGIETYGIGYMSENDLAFNLRNESLAYFDKWFVVGDNVQEFYLKFLSELLTVAPH